VRIVAYADSLAMPRPELGVRWEDTWPYQLGRLLRQRGLDAEIINRGQRARTADSLTGQEPYENVVWVEPDVVVLQIGVVDCAPRIISRREKQVLNLPGFPVRVRDAMIERRKAHRLQITGRDPLSKVYTPPADFRRYFNDFGALVDSMDSQPELLVVPVVVDLRPMEQKSPGYTENVIRYNRILERFCEAPRRRLVQAPPLTDDGPSRARMFCSDHYHLSAAGNHELAQVLAEIIGTPSS
jgi:acyl-CoA thioesterase I